MALVEQELADCKARNRCQRLDACGQDWRPTGTSSAFGSGKRDVGPVRSRFRLESTKTGGPDDFLLKVHQLRARLNFGIQNANALKDTQSAKLDGNGNPAHLFELTDEAVVLLRACTPKKLQRDVPRLGSRPSEFRSRAKRLREPDQLIDNRALERNTYEEAHTQIV